MTYASREDNQHGEVGYKVTVLIVVVVGGEGERWQTMQGE